MGWLKAFIPQHLSNAQVLWFLDICTHFKILKKKGLANRRANAEAFTKDFPSEGHFFTQENFIENQPQWKPVKFGKYSMDYSGCEIIATYNALLSLGEKLSQDDMIALISRYEKKGAVLCGGWGVAPRAVYRFFKEKGYDVCLTCSRGPADINTMGERYGTIIINVYNDAEDITRQIHTMNVSKNDKNCFILHNCYRTGKDGRYVMSVPYGSLYDVIRSINGGKAQPICIIGVNPLSNLCQNEEQKI